MNFIKKNYKDILLFVGIGSLGILVQAMMPRLNTKLSEYDYFYLAYLLLIIGAAASVIILAIRNQFDRPILNVGIILLLFSDLIISLYSLIKNQNSSAVFSFITGIALTGLICYSIIKVKKASFTMLFTGIEVVMLMPNVFMGAKVDFVKVLLFIIFTIYYFIIEKKEIENQNDLC